MAIRWDKFTVKSQEAFQQANDIASQHGNPEMLPVLLEVLDARPRLATGRVHRAQQKVEGGVVDRRRPLPVGQGEGDVEARGRLPQFGSQERFQAVVEQVQHQMSPSRVARATACTRLRQFIFMSMSWTMFFTVRSE